jgi:hypothetical protein
VVLRQPWFERDYTPEDLACFWHGAAGFPWKKQTVDAYYALDVVNRLMAQVDARTVEVADELGLEPLDLRRVLQPGRSTYFDYVHFTPEGARAVADATAGALLRQPAVEAPQGDPVLVEALPPR